MSDPLLSKVIRALNLNLMIHGAGGQSVMITATTKKAIVVYSAAHAETMEQALDQALTSALDRVESKRANIKVVSK